MSQSVNIYDIIIGLIHYTGASMKFSEWLKYRLEDSPNIKNSNQLAKAIGCNRATVSLWLSGGRYPKKAYLVKVVDVLSKSKTDRKKMILEIWGLEDGL